MPEMDGNGCLNAVLHRSSVAPAASAAGDLAMAGSSEKPTNEWEN